MSEIAFHNEMRDSLVNVSVNGVPATGDQINRLLLVLNFDYKIRNAVAQAFDNMPEENDVIIPAG